MNPDLIDYYIINCPIPSKIAIENRYQIDFGNPVTISKILLLLEGKESKIKIKIDMRHFNLMALCWPRMIAK